MLASHLSPRTAARIQPVIELRTAATGGDRLSGGTLHDLMVLPTRSEFSHVSSVRTFAIDASTGRSSLRPAACALYRVGIHHATLLRLHRELSKRRWDDGVDGDSLSRSAR